MNVKGRCKIEYLTLVSPEKNALKRFLASEKKQNTLGEGYERKSTFILPKKLNYETDSWDLYAALKEGRPWIVIDGRSAEAYEQEHIPGSINLPHKDICSAKVESLDPGKTYVCYCDGIGCNASTKTALKLLTLGFDVKELLGGLDWWKRDGYATEGFQWQSGTDVICGCS